MRGNAHVRFWRAEAGNGAGVTRPPHPFPTRHLSNRPAGSQSLLPARLAPNWAKSIYFKDPNGISLEYCCLVRDFVEDDANMQERFEISVKALGLDQMNVAEITTAQSHSYKAKAS